MNEVLDTLTVGGEAKDLSKVVKQFPVRAGEKPWTVKEVTALADELVAERERLESELASSDAELIGVCPPSTMLASSGRMPPRSVAMADNCSRLLGASTNSTSAPAST